jgi:RNA polymerase sigma-70 factor (ECF subfamily)
LWFFLIFLLELLAMSDNISNRDRQLALERLFESHGRTVTVFLFTLLGVWDEAADLCQETFIVAFRKFDDYDSGRPAGAWLRGIARNLARNALRKRGRYRRLLAKQRQFESIFGIWTAEEKDGDQFAALADGLSRCIKKLTPRQRETVCFTYEKGKPAREVAELMKIKEGTVYQLLWQARSALRDCLAAASAGGKKQ